ncbi:SURF1 family protein [Nitzschia inconspicua]|uniref:SURF1 family protein n=1 Tax=Nitzschia inconspicua TaxID=303405 RepID=A0A9K3PY46_9STRA|nr:SURF1 family protein [Nitzschia inconspicua]
MSSDPRTRDDAILLEGDDAMEEDEDLFDEPIDNDGPQGVASSGADGTPASSISGVHMDLISTIITPSPFAHHTTGPTSSRYRNALQRITAHPLTDTEAWQALLTEVSTCWKSLQTTKNIHALDAETQLQLDWIESCYGALLKYFPYSCSHYAAIGEILLVLSAQVGEEGGPAADYGGLLGNSQRSQQAQVKLETILRETLGFDVEGNVPKQDEETDLSSSGAVTAIVMPMEGAVQANTSGPTHRKRKIMSVDLGGMCTSSVELWQLYIKTSIRHSRRKHRINSQTSQNIDAAKAVLEDSKKAYELALEHAGSTCFDNNILWRDYVSFCKSLAPPPMSEQERNASMMLMTPQQHMLWLRSIYQKLVCHPMTGLDQFWQEYELFERQQSEALATALLQELQPKYQHARNVYLERNKVFNLQLLEWKTRLATPPVSSSKEGTENGEGSSGGSGSGGTGAENTKKSEEGGGGSNEETVQEYNSKMQDEFDYLTEWKKRCAFERTNPERLTSQQDLAHRVRQSYKEMLCVLTLYPEAWHMWSMWEDTLPLSSSEGNRAVAVLQLGQECIPDSGLLAQAQAQLMEIQAASAGSNLTENGKKGPKPADALHVMKKYLDRAPTSLGFCIYQRLVRRYKGVEAARSVFARGRRVLSSGVGESVTKLSSLGVEKKESSSAAVGGSAINGTSLNDSSDGENISMRGKRLMVTNRLDPSIGSQDGIVGSSSSRNSTVAPQENSTTHSIIPPGPVTWHLYACHANIEHRLNKLPDVAARIYELGLRRHASFLTKPPYVIKYAELLMELQDTVNLRALLTRALAACGESKNSEQVEALWNMTLQCEEMWSITDPSNLEVALSVERRRRAALFGPEIEDVSTGSRVGMGDSNTPFGVHKSSLAEQLIRSDGYDPSSRIVNGLGRTVDVLDIMGMWGDGTAGRQYIRRVDMDDVDEVNPGGKSDRSYQRRLQFARRLAAGVSMEAMGASDAGSKLLTARERLQQQGGTPGFQNTPIQMAIQQMPEWIRSMVLLLPASRLRSSIVPKAPPHLIEMALSSLRQNKLPAERPTDDIKTTESGNKRSASAANIGGGDSSDDEVGPSGSGGYGAQFRARQRSRITNN